jgi:hypothetical protein
VAGAAGTEVESDRSPEIPVYSPVSFRKLTGLCYDSGSEDTRTSTVGALTHVLVANMTFRLPPGLDGVKVAVLVTVGSREFGIMFGSARDIVAAIPTAHGYVVRGAPHNWPLAVPGLFNWTARAWIERRTTG